MRKMTIIAAVIILVAFLSACGGYKKTDDAKIVARINNYEMTADDFKDGMRLTMSNKHFSSDPAKAKEMLLDEMITKTILLQEAQRQNFDKDKAFMKEIERYWEQALLKLLIKKKTAEISKNIKIGDKETKQGKIQEALLAWITSLRSHSKITINKKVLDETEVVRR